MKPWHLSAGPWRRNLFGVWRRAFIASGGIRRRIALWLRGYRKHIYGPLWSREYAPRRGMAKLLWRITR